MIKGKNLKAKELLEMLQENCKNFEYKTPINLDTILECLKVNLSDYFSNYLFPFL